MDGVPLHLPRSHFEVFCKAFVQPQRESWHNAMQIGMGQFMPQVGCNLVRPGGIDRKACIRLDEIRAAMANRMGQRCRIASKPFWRFKQIDVNRFLAWRQTKRG